MRQIQRPETNAVHWFDLIQKSKGEPISGDMVAARTAILAAYQEYDRIAPAVDKLNPASLSASQIAALCHAYNSPTKAINDLRALILGAGQSPRCPYCSIGEAETLDHYTPKSLWPAFTIFPSNLVPCCDSCNRRKSVKLLEVGTKLRMFLHPYFDEIPHERVLLVKIRVRNDSIGTHWKITSPATLASVVAARLESHFIQLDLADRYRRFSNDEMRGQAHAMNKAFQKGGFTRLTLSLQKQAKTLSKAFGPNHWRVVLYETLAKNEEFCSTGYKLAAKLS